MPKDKIDQRTSREQGVWQLLFEGHLIDIVVNFQIAIGLWLADGI